ncbi:MAG: substrate-binding periplasmic protein [Massilia sp.]
MSKRLTWPAAIALLLCCAAAQAGPPELVMLAPLNHTMPIARFSDNELAGGILKDLGELLAAKLGRSARFIAVPSRRVSMMLATGKADGVCFVQPHWIDGEYHWSAELIPTGGVVLARADAPPVLRLDDLRGKRVGTVAGYRYRYLEPLLGKDFVRDDAPSAEHNLRKLLAGRTRYALLEQSTAAWQVKNDTSHSLRLDVIYEHNMARCAFAQNSTIPYAEIKRATDSIIAEHGVDKIMARYR